jgi:hypothetical protein
MRELRCTVLAVALASAAAWGAAAIPARAQGVATATADDRRQAAKDFAEGDRAFATGDFRRAALAYDRAYARVPHHDVLWNEARAWHRAGELAHAANLYARYLRDAPSAARDRNSAQRALDELAGKLAKLEIHADGITDITVDDAPVDSGAIYVTPGTHIIKGKSADGSAVHQEKDVRAGDDVSLALVAPPPAPSPPPSTDASPAPAPAPETSASTRSWPPLVVWIGGGATLALAGVTVWSGLDTVAQKNTFEQNPTRQDVLSKGQSAQLRTNVLLAATGGVGLLTAAAAVFFVDWHGHASSETNGTARLGFGPGSVLVRGSF